VAEAGSPPAAGSPPNRQLKLVEGIDYYKENGKMVLKAYFLLKRGYCCNSGCRHCPYNVETAPKVEVSIIGLKGSSET
jgi:hypothetical protein